jgi:hypothetical protein
MSGREYSLVLGIQQPSLFEISQYLSHRAQAEVWWLVPITGGQNLGLRTEETVADEGGASITTFFFGFVDSPLLLRFSLPMLDGRLSISYVVLSTIDADKVLEFF